MGTAPPASKPKVHKLTPPDGRAQVNIAGRAAAISPANADTLAAFAGVYASHQLPEVAGKPAEAGFELSITVNSQGAPTVPSWSPPFL